MRTTLPDARPGGRRDAGARGMTPPRHDGGHAARGLVVRGLPSHDFRQEDADAKKPADVCFNTDGVRFPMFATAPVRDRDAQPVFRQLAAATGQAPSGNVNKHLVGCDGVPIAHFGSMVAPTGRSLTAAIERALAAPAPRARP